MPSPFADSVRDLATGPITWRTWVGLITIPAIIASLLTWAFWATGEDHGTIKAAVVNNDRPVTVNKQLVPIGRELAAKLTHNPRSSYRWELTDAEDAEAGLADGTYAIAVTIPENFSASATSSGTADPLNAAQATLAIKASQNTDVVDPGISKEIAQATVGTLNTQIVETYLDNIYVGFSTIHGQLAKAAKGARELADGTGKLAGGAHELAAGAGKLSAAADRLAAGAAQLADGTAQLEKGSGKLAKGLTKAERDTAALPELTRRLADGARQVADGNRQLANVIVPLADRVIQVIDRLPTAKAAAQRFQKLAAQCEERGGEPSFCALLSQAADRFSAEAARIDGLRDKVRASVVQIRNNIRALADGAEKVADGNARLAAKAGELVKGIAAAADGARKLHAGIGQANDGAHKLASGSRQLAGGAGQLAGGAGQLAGGADKVNAGAGELASGLRKGLDQIPSYNDQERGHLKKVAATPVAAHSSLLPHTGKAAAVLFLVLALWASALATYTVTRAVPADVLTSRRPTWRITLHAALPGATVAIITAALLSLGFAPVLGLSLGDVPAFVAVTMLAALAFVMLNQAAIAIFKRPGRIASVVVLVLTLATGVISTVPGFFTKVEGLLPTHAAIQALRSVITGADGGVTAVVYLLAWLALGMIATTIVTDRRRSLHGSRIRLDSAPKARRKPPVAEKPVDALA